MNNQKSINERLKEEFLKAFTYAMKMREAEQKQKPFKVANNGRVEFVVCFN